MRAWTPARVETLAGIVKLQTAKPAMVKLASAQFLEEVHQAFLHSVYAVAALQNGQIH